MSIPTSYTNATLIEYMRYLIQGSGAEIEDFSELISDTLIAYGTDSVSKATDIPKLRAIAAFVCWSRVVSLLAGVYDFTADGGSYKRSQMASNAQKELSKARALADQYMSEDVPSENDVAIGTMAHVDEYTPDEILNE